MPWFTSLLVLLMAQAPPMGGSEMDVAELRRRNESLSFTADSARRAFAVLESGLEGDPVEIQARAVALLTLGCGGAEAAVGLLEATLETGELPERRAAVFSLGELGVRGFPTLEGLLAGDHGGVEAALCLALGLSEGAGCVEAGERLRKLAEGDSPMARRARLVLAFVGGGAAREFDSTLRLYYELRWVAARSYGFVDGRRGQMALATELFANPEFLDRVVLSAAAELRDVELKAHLTEILREGDRIGALRVAVLLMPEELTRALKSGHWEPTVATWHDLLDEIDSARVERASLELLKSAYQAAPELQPHAGRLLVRSGGDMPWSWIEEQLEGGTPEERSALIDACGERGKQRIPDLSNLLEKRSDLGVAGDCLVALIRLGHPPAKLAFEALAKGGDTPARRQAIDALARVLHDRSIWSLGERVLGLEDLPQYERLDLLVGFAQNGAAKDLTELREALPVARRSEKRLAAVRALARNPGPDEIEFLAQLFPVEGDMELNVQLALALLRERNPVTGQLLHSALWDDAWNRSVLAGGLIVHNSGTRGLMDELELAPRTATEKDLRRVGFALGEWGGLGAVEELARTRSEGDPALQGALLGALSSRAAEEVIDTGRIRVLAPVQFPPASAPGSGGAKGKGKRGGRGRRGGGRS